VEGESVRVAHVATAAVIAAIEAHEHSLVGCVELDGVHALLAARARPRRRVGRSGERPAAAAPPPRGRGADAARLRRRGRIEALARAQRDVELVPWAHDAGLSRACQRRRQARQPWRSIYVRVSGASVASLACSAISIISIIIIIWQRDWRSTRNERSWHILDVGSTERAARVIAVRVDRKEFERGRVAHDRDLTSTRRHGDEKPHAWSADGSRGRDVNKTVF
jgi:hypothetical protein